ncbi:MAG: hypothetical protein KTR35_20190 [Gammaproteobacteria bacterium]|nr:hypothetical protein [Gammaproteobacteria bacterium]
MKNLFIAAALLFWSLPTLAESGSSIDYEKIFSRGEWQLSLGFGSADINHAKNFNPSDDNPARLDIFGLWRIELMRSIALSGDGLHRKNYLLFLDDSTEDGLDVRTLGIGVGRGIRIHKNNLIGLGADLNLSLGLVNADFYHENSSESDNTAMIGLNAQVSLFVSRFILSLNGNLRETLPVELFDNSDTLSGHAVYVSMGISFY